MAELTQIAFNPEANTAILPENRKAMDTYFQLAEKKHRDKVFEYGKLQDEIKQKADSLNFDVGQVWEADEAPIRDKIFALRDYIDSTPDAIDPTSKNYSQYKKMADDVNFDINKSKQNKEIYDNYLKLIANGKIDPSHREDIEAYKKASLGDRKDLILSPDIEFNPMDYMTKLQPAFSYELGKGEPTGVGGMVKFTSKPSEESVKLSLGSAWDASPSNSNVKQHYNSLYNENEEVQKQYKSPKDFYVQSLTPIGMSMKGKEQIRNIPDYGNDGSTKDKEGDQSFFVDGAADVLGGKGEVTDFEKSGKLPTNTLFNGLKFGTTKDGYDRFIKFIVNKNGKLYAVTDEDKTKAGTNAIIADPDHEIKNMWSQIIVPYFNQEYGAGADVKLQKLKDYAIKNGTASKLGIPTGNQGNTETKIDDPLGLFK